MAEVDSGDATGLAEKATAEGGDSTTYGGGKFEDVAKLDAGYLSGQTKITEQAEQLKAITAERDAALEAAPKRSDETGKFTQKTNLTGAPAEATVEAIVAAAGLDTEAMSTAYSENGHLTEEQYEAFATVKFKLGDEEVPISRSMVDSYIKGEQAEHQLSEFTAVEEEKFQAEALVTVHKMVGGEDQYNAMRMFLANQVKSQEPELAADIEKRLLNGSLYKFAMADLKALYIDAVGGSSDNTMIQGTPAAGEKGWFDNQQEADAAIAESRKTYGNEWENDANLMSRMNHPKTKI